MVQSNSKLIEIKEKEILKSKRNLAKKYQSLGETIALFVKEKPFSFCLNELATYEIAKGEYERLTNKADKIKSKVDILEDYKKQAYDLRKSLISVKNEERVDLSRFGAAIYEAYTHKKLNYNISKRLDTIFGKIDESIKKYKKRVENSSSPLVTSFNNMLLINQRKKLFNYFVDAASLIINERLEKELNINKKEEYLKSLGIIISERVVLEGKIEKFESEIEKMKSDNIHSPGQRLDEVKKEVALAKEVKLNAVILLGEELYNKLPNNITSEEIGLDAISLMDKITLDLAKIDSLEQDIVKLNNEIVITELSAQIAHERNKIKTLEDEILSCKAQISKINNIINQKRDKIIELKNEGTFEESALDLISLDESDGNTKR